MSEAFKPAPLIASITPEIGRCYLDNVAITLCDVIIPALSGGARTHAEECLRIVSRIVSNSELSATAVRLLAEGGPLAEGKAIEQVNREGEAALAKYIAGAAPVAVTQGPDPAPLQAWLRGQVPGGENLRVTTFRKLSGGRSKITLLAELEDAGSLPARIVIRQDGEEWITGKAVVDEENLLRRLHAAGLRVPEPLLIEPSGTVLGKPFLVVPAFPGKPPGEHFLILPKSEEAFLQLADQLGRLHALPINDFLAMGSIREADYTAAQLRESLATYRTAIEAQDHAPSTLLSAVFEWLDDNAPRMSRVPRALVHADAGFHNMLVDGDRLVVVLDWELAHIGNPAYDLGYIRHGVLDPAQWERFMARYRAAGGPDVPPECVEYFTLFTGIWYHQLQLKARGALLSGGYRNMELAALLADFAPQFLSSISRAFHRAMKPGQNI
jgi:aminoglycoside phosphotransferase (APT) family kinase protein